MRKLNLISCIALALGCLFTAQHARAALVYVGGHADLGVGFEGGNLHLHIHAEDTLNLFGGGTLPAGEYDADQLMIGVPGNSISRPAGAEWNFMAPNAGAQVWFLPQGTDLTKPFLGVGTEELLPANGWTTPLTWTFNSITTISGAPSAFSLWQGGVTPQVFASSLQPTNGSQDPLRTGNSWRQNPFSHDHFNYSFTGEGIYDVSLTISGRNATLAQDFSDTVSFRFVTGNAIITAVPEPSSLALLSLAGIGAYRFRRKFSAVAKA